MVYILFFFFSTNAQPSIHWTRAYGGSAYDMANSVLQTPDGGYIVGGSTQSFFGDVTDNHGGVDYWVVKLSSTGTIQWQRTYGGKGDEWLYSLVQTSDGGFILAGTSDSASGDVSAIRGHGQNDYWIVKISSTGALEWEKSYGGTLGDFANSIQQTSDGGYIVAGHSNSNDGDITSSRGDFDGWVVKLSATGALQWQKSYGGSGDDKAYTIIKTSEGGYIISGQSTSTNGDATGNHGAYDIWVVKISALGSVEWHKCYGGSANEFEFDIKQTFDGGYSIGASASSTDGDLSGVPTSGSPDLFLKISSTGAIQWQKFLSTSTTAIQQTPDGGYMVAGGRPGTGGHSASNFGVVKLSSTGTEQWSGTYGGSNEDRGLGLSLTTDGGCIVVGLTNSNDIDVHVSGHHGGGDIWVVKLNAVTGLENIFGERGVNLYPNPTTGAVLIGGTDNLSVKVYNSMGMEVLVTGYVKDFSLQNLPPGIYFARLFDSNKQFVSLRKLIKM